MAVGGDDVVDAWYREQDGEVRGKLDALLEHLGNRHRSDWRRPHFDLLSGICKGLGEIRLKARSGQHRVLGFFGPERMTFTLVTCFKKTRRVRYGKRLPDWSNETKGCCVRCIPCPTM